VKRIIDGKAYNTETAILVATSGEPWEWSLYQTRQGAFFFDDRDEKGDSAFRPMTDAEAQAFLEKNANHLVEQYFGPMPEAGTAERRLTIRIPGNLADRVEAAAEAKGLSLNGYAMRSLGQSAAADEKMRAAESIEAVLSSLESAKREPDLWESRCLTEAIGALYRGLYRLALVESGEALTPVDQRSNCDSAKQARRFSLRELRNTFAVADAEPVRPFPQFGRIHFADDDK
jgi:hypothetical protein